MSDPQGRVEQWEAPPVPADIPLEPLRRPSRSGSSRSTFWWRVVLLGMVTLIASAAAYFLIDQPVAWFARHRDPATRDLARLISSPGDATWVLSASVLVLAISWAAGSKMWASRAGLMLSSTARAGLLVQPLKWLFGRHRPADLYDHNLWGFQFFSSGFRNASFPSGHACVIAATCAVLWLIWPRWWLAWVVLGVVACAGRVLGERHFISDVFTGGYFGALCAVIIYRLWVQRFPSIHGDGLEAGAELSTISAK